MSACNNCGRLDCRECHPPFVGNISLGSLRASDISFGHLIGHGAPEPLCETTASVPSGEMVERVARAIAFKMQGTCDKPEDERTWQDYARAARFALAQLREPTEAMVDAVLVLSIERENVATDVWQAMLEAALK